MVRGKTGATAQASCILEKYNHLKKDTCMYTHTKTCIKMFITGLCVINKNWKNLNTPSGQICIDIYISIYISEIKRNEHTITWMNIKITTVNESQTPQQKNKI